MFLCNSSLLFFQSFCFPVACGHRRCCFTGRSSKPLRGILLSVDDKIPTQQQIEEFTEDSLRYLNDVKSTFEKITEKNFSLHLLRKRGREIWDPAFDLHATRVLW